MAHLWKFIHNALVHGLLMPWPWEPYWVTRAHDWTQARWVTAERGPQMSTGKRRIFCVMCGAELASYYICKNCGWNNEASDPEMKSKSND